VVGRRRFPDRRRTPAGARPAADQDWADRRASLDAREQWLTRAAELSLERLRTLDAVTRREDLLHLAREGAMRVGGTAVEILVGLEDLPLADPQWIADVAAATPATVTVAASPNITGGCIARGADGRLSYDNTFTTRLRRLDAGWRQALSELFEGPQAVTDRDRPAGTGDMTATAEIVEVTGGLAYSAHRYRFRSARSPTSVTSVCSRRSSRWNAIRQPSGLRGHGRARPGAPVMPAAWAVDLGPDS
jgi:hypothetical protein